LLIVSGWNVMQDVSNNKSKVVRYTWLIFISNNLCFY
jgi:hypothetical protein